MDLSPRELVELLLLGPTNDRRQLQDSPILGDVWIAFANRPDRPRDLLITPHLDRSAGRVAAELAQGIRQRGADRRNLPPDFAPHIAYLQGLVAARLFFREIVVVVVPLTKWWKDRRIPQQLDGFRSRNLETWIAPVLDWARHGATAGGALWPEKLEPLDALERYLLLAAILVAAGQAQVDVAAQAECSPAVGQLLEDPNAPATVAARIRDLLDQLAQAPAGDPYVWQISLNRKAVPALDKSVPSVKGDAARALFKVDCREIKWAVVDSGIDGNHPAFHDPDGNLRIVRALDFRNIRQIVSLDNLDTDSPAFMERCQALSVGPNLDPKVTGEILKQLALDANNDRPIHWESVERLIRIDPRTRPPGGHGTHVAGILAGNSKGVLQPGGPPGEGFADGMCPDLRLYDLRVLGKTLEDTEFAIIAALQYIRSLNDRHGYISIHGVNLSLSIPHDVRNFACGRTPVCNECERLVESGVVVVAAAGNFGYQAFETARGRFESYAAFSITDPGNAESVLTVGATHRSWPHTYGISFFSSRGPTGDGRMKPDLVAPGERIQSCLPEGGWGELDGTSMAAPHASGAAAMLMARYAELIGQPRQIKRVLCDSATDLGRERSFQGHGMLDVLRAFQKI